MVNELSLQMLGPIQITLNGQNIKGFESQKAVALLCFLAYTGQPVTRSRLANLFWGSKPERRGLANLSRVLFNLKNLLPGYLNINYKTIQFNQYLVDHIDTQAFTEYVAEGSRDCLVRAVSLYRSEFMEGVSLADCPEFEFWLMNEQEQWRQRIAHAYHELISIFTEEGSYHEGITYASRLLAIHPWREETHRRLIYLLALSGQRLAAIQQFKVCSRILEEELGTIPGEETRILYERIVRGEKLVSGHVPVTGETMQATEIYSSLPAELPALQDGEDELNLILSRLRNNACRILLLKGARGSTTRRDILALYAAAYAKGDFRDGVFYLPSPGNYEIEAFTHAVGDTGHLTNHNLNQAERIFAFFRDKEMLLVIVNAVKTPTLTSLLEGILKRSPRVKILITAAQPLDSPLEWIFDIHEQYIP